MGEPDPTDDEQFSDPLALFTAAACALAYAWWRMTKWSHDKLYA